MYENVDGLQNRIEGNEKLQKIKDLADELEAGLIAINEHKMRIGHKLNRNGRSQMFNGGETEIRSVMGGNTHEQGGSKVQQEGTGMLLYGSLIDQYDFEAASKDTTGLGRWVHMVLQGEDGIKTRFVYGYNPYPSGKKATKSSYQQHRRYFTKKEKDRTCLRTRFRQDLIKQLVQWREQGIRLVVCLDANGDISLQLK